MILVVIYYLEASETKKKTKKNRDLRPGNRRYPMPTNLELAEMGIDESVIPSFVLQEIEIDGPSWHLLDTVPTKEHTMRL